MYPQQLNTITDLKSDFHSVLNRPKAAKKRMAPLSVRLSKEQRAQLERDTVGMSLNAYVLSKLFDDGDKPKKPRRKQPTKRDKALARALRRLSHSGIAAYLVSQILAKEEGRLILSIDEEKQLREAYALCDRIRRDIVEAMGLNPHEGA